MTSDTNARDPSRTGQNMGQAGAMLASAMAEIFARAFDIAGRRSGQSVLASLSPGQDSGTPSSWIDALLANYRQYLGEMVTTLPAVAQRIAADLRTGKGDRPLFLAQLPVLEGFCKTNATTGLAVTPATVKAICDAAEGESIAPKDVPGLLKSAHVLLDGEGVRDLPALFDRLKHDFRARGKAALPQIRNDLIWLLQDKQNIQSCKMLDALSHALGETAVRKVLSKHWLEKYAAAVAAYVGSREQPAEAGKTTGIHALASEFGQAFRKPGIVLSDRLSLLTNPTDALLLDHANDAVFEIRRPTPLLAGELTQDIAATTDMGLSGKLHRVYGSREGRRYKINGRELLLPLRVHDARQGTVVWSIDKLTVQELLDNRQDFGHLKAWDIGGGSTPIALFMVDYCEGDLGAYGELGLGCFAAPRRDPLAVGMFALGTIHVTTDLARDVGKSVWGFEKETSDLELRCAHREATCVLKSATGGADLKLTLPRGGEGSSQKIPMFAYTIKDGAWHRTVITRSGNGEALQGGGRRVALSTGRPSATSRTGAPRLADNLYHLGITNRHGELARAPIFTVWTEHMSAELESPSVVTTREVAFPY